MTNESTRGVDVTIFEQKIDISRIHVDGMNMADCAGRPKTTGLRTKRHHADQDQGAVAITTGRCASARTSTTA